MFVVKNGNRQHRQEMAAKLLAGIGLLMVIGSVKQGFRLAVQPDERTNYGVGRLYIVGPAAGFEKQSDAVAYGVKHFNRKAAKVRSEAIKAEAIAAA